MGLRLVTAPTAEILSLADAKRHLRAEDFDDDDTLIQSYIDAAISLLDGRDGLLQRAIAPQTWALELGCFPCGAIALPLPPLQEVQSIEYLDPEGSWQTLDEADWQVDLGDAQAPGRVVPVASWPATGSAPVTVRVTFRAGYAVATGDEGEAPPAQLLHLLRLLVANWYETREPVVIGTIVNDLPLAAQTLIANLRVYR